MREEQVEELKKNKNVKINGIETFTTKELERVKKLLGECL